jgi:hypothetical protein
MRVVASLVIAMTLGCNGSTPAHAPDAANDTVVIDDTLATTNPLALACTASDYDPAPCPAPAGGAGQATLCYRPQWPGVTSVDVYVDRGNAGDWTTPFATLADHGDGTFQATAALANGTYPYLFRVHGAAADGLVPDGQYMLDQTNGAFVPAPANAPIKRSVSQLTVPQVASPVHHVRGTVVVAGAPQPCFSVRLDVGELRKPGGAVLSEHYVANVVESRADGTFDLPVADGELMVNIKYPFELFASYPDPAATPSVGVTRTGTTMAGADLVVDPADVAYDGYAQIAPASGTATLPVDLAWSLVAGASQSAAAVIATNIAGNDPAYISTYGGATTTTWDGMFGNGMMAKLDTTYWWGTWQKRGVWTSESLLFPITFH